MGEKGKNGKKGENRRKKSKREKWKKRGNLRNIKGKNKEKCEE